MHSTSVAVSREPRRAKTDRLDTEMLIRVFLGWLRGEPRHCKMVAIPTLEEEDARRPSRERETLVGERTRIINRMKAALVAASLWTISARRRTRSGYKLGNHFIWLEPRWVASSPLCAAPGESYSDVIIRLAALELVALVPNDSCPRPSTRFVQSRSNSGDDIGRGGGEWGSPAIMGSDSAARPVGRSARRHPRHRTSPTTPCMSCESRSRISYRRLLVNRA
jgi:hypothetical protein